MILLRPEKVKGVPAVIVLHGTGGNKERPARLHGGAGQRNIIGVAIDARYHGERAGGAKGAAAYNEAITRAWQTKAGEPMEHPFYYDTCWDLWRLADYLRTARRRGRQEARHDRLQHGRHRNLAGGGGR